MEVELEESATQSLHHLVIATYYHDPCENHFAMVPIQYQILLYAAALDREIAGKFVLVEMLFEIRHSPKQCPKHIYILTKRILM